MIVYRECFETYALYHHFAAILTAFKSAVSVWYSLSCLKKYNLYFTLFKTSGSFTLVAITRTTTVITAPFIHIRWLLFKISMKESKLCMYNNNIVLCLWLIFRIFPIVPIQLHFYSLVNTTGWHQAGFWNIAICALSSLLDFFNIYYFYIIIRLKMQTVPDQIAKVK